MDGRNDHQHNPNASGKYVQLYMDWKAAPKNLQQRWLRFKNSTQGRTWARYFKNVTSEKQLEEANKSCTEQKSSRNPASIHDFEVPPELQVTKRGDSFLMYDSWPQNDERMLICTN